MARVANNELSNGYSDYITIKHGDFTAEATTQTFTLAIPAGGIVRSVGYYLETAFDGGSTSALAIDIGDGSDADGFLDNIETHVDATEVTYSNGVGAYIDGGTGTEQQGKLYTTADTIDILFTASGANVSELDTGKITVFVDMKRLNPESV
jgi:hypothetical protein|tara:strand:- start:1060 stop:1512 length:453 start_codon:yes stop_codon:yes gene_type:complete